MFYTDPAPTTKQRLDWDTLTEVSQKFSGALSPSAIFEDHVSHTKESYQKKAPLEFAVLE